MALLKFWTGSSWYSPSGFNRPRVWNGSSWVPSTPFAFSVGVPTKTLTVGTQYNPGGKFTTESTEYGYEGGVYGSLSDTTLPYSWSPDSVVSALYYDTSAFGNEVRLISTGPDELSNSGWTTLVINGTAFSRSSASFYSYSDGLIPATWFTFWTWTVAANPFPAVGSSTTVTWS